MSVEDIERRRRQNFLFESCFRKMASAGRADFDCGICEGNGWDECFYKCPYDLKKKDESDNGNEC